MVSEKNKQSHLGRPPIPAGTERILFVDDEEHLAELWGEMLESLGYHVTAYTSSREALETFKANPDRFDLMITDMTMPQLTGAELSKEIRRIRPELPIILCTGFSVHISEREAEDMGIRRFLTKPLALLDLANTIREVLDEH
ncbi:MAG: response regulator [Deltaproteobacteria bacterium]|nr:response regulator [Deltaproteobacteria bacterium]